MKRWIYLFAIAIFFVSLSGATAFAQPAQPPEDKTLSPYFFVEGGDPAVDELPLKDTRVEVAITGVIADVTVRQVYENRGSRPVHARYVFPASTRAAVYGMTMTIGDKRIVAKIQERERAKKEFEKAKHEGKSASLLEESRPNVFSMNVANVMPQDTIGVELKYTELLVPTSGVYEFVYPTVVGPRYSSKSENKASASDQFVKTGYTHEGEVTKSEFHLSAKLSTGVPMQDLASPSHPIVSRPTGPARTDVTLDGSDPFSGNRDFILRYRLSGTQISSGLLLYQGTNENLFLLMAQPPASVNVDQIPAREYIFVLDVSGSMNGFPLDTAKKLMGDLIKVLRPTDTFNVVLFADGSKTLAPESLPATQANLLRAVHFIGPQPGGGGTELLAAIRRASSIPRQPNLSRTIVLLTDGYIDAEKDCFAYIRDHLDQANVFSFGIGSSVNRYLVEGVARAGQGEPFVVTKPEEASRVADKFRQYIQSPVLTGIRLSFSGFDAYDVEPAKIPDLFASRPIVVFGKWRGRPDGTVELSGTNGRDPYRATFAVAQAQPDDQHAALRYLWARTRIGNLSDFADENPGRIAEVTSLGLSYSLLTQYTSFIAVQEVIRNASGTGEDVDQPLPLPLGVTDLAIGESVASGAEPDLVWLAAAFLLALLGCKCVKLRTAGARVAS
jgi:Ca-activated chloride channel family protein